MRQPATRTIFPSVEPLESRIAPALVIGPGGASATFTDVDGDVVTVSVSHGVLDRGDFSFSKVGAVVSGGKSLVGISLAGEPDFAGADISINAVRGPLGGDGHVNVGSIFAEGIDLGRVKVDGDLGSIVAGDGAGGTPAASAITVGSFGAASSATIGSELAGALGALKVRGDFSDANLYVHGSIRSIEIRGSLLGSEQANSAQIDARGSIGAVTIGGGIYGGSGSQSGAIHAHKSLGTTSVGGTIAAGSGTLSGTISSDASIGSVVANVSAGPSGTLTEANGGLVKTGTGTLTLTGSNTFNGTTPATPTTGVPVSGGPGSFDPGTTGSTPSGGTITVGGGSISVGPGGTLPLGGTLTLTRPEIETFDGRITYDGPISTTAPVSIVPSSSGGAGFALTTGTAELELGGLLAAGSEPYLLIDASA